jgi:hypothetical protein
MMKKYLFLLTVGVLVSCQDTLVNEPDVISADLATTTKEFEKVSMRNQINPAEARIKGLFDYSLKNETLESTTPETLATFEMIKALQSELSEGIYSYSKTATNALAATPSGVTVGVFKMTTCGSDPEFVYFMDNEDGGWSNCQGNTGSTWTDGNGNTEFHFCRVTPGNYGGGTLLLATYQWAPSEGNCWIVDRFHDNEDSDNKNEIRQGASFKLGYIGHCAFDKNTRLTWRFHDTKSMSLPYSYAVLTNSGTTDDCRINIDDENSKNANSALLWTHNASNGGVSERYLAKGERFRGISHSENTVYHLKIYQ